MSDLVYFSGRQFRSSKERKGKIIKPDTLKKWWKTVMKEVEESEFRKMQQSGRHIMDGPTHSDNLVLPRGFLLLNTGQ